MPAVENETLLLYYHSIVESKLKFLFGSGDPAQKMFVLLSEACGEFQKLQKGACTKSQRHASTSIILQNLNEIVTQINNKQIPDEVGGEPITWFEYAGEVYTVYDLSHSLIIQYVEYQSSIDSFYESTPPPPRRHYTASSRETSPQPSSSNAGSRLPRHHSDTSGPSRSNGGHHGGAHSPRERAPAREPKINLWSLQEIETKNMKLIDVYESSKVLQDYVTRRSGVYGRLSEENTHKQLVTSYDPLGERDEIRIYTVMQESLQAMATLISDGDVEDIKTYEYGRPPHPYEMSKVVNTLMHDVASNISRLSTRFDTHTAPTLKNASINSLLLRIQRLSI